jgi:hypothetical protein
MAIKLVLREGTDQHFGSFSVVYSREILGENICYFAGHSVFFEYPDQLFYYLAKIAAVGMEIIFISSSRIGVKSLEKLKVLCSAVIEKENKGLDFGSWRVALSLTGFGTHFGSVLLANDSVFGPFYDLKPIFQTFSSGQWDFYGLTRSLQQDEHIQSYFVLIKHQVLESAAWTEFWENMNCYADKDEVVEKHEIQFTQKLLSAGFQYGVWSDWMPLATEKAIRKKISTRANLFQTWTTAFNSSPLEFYKDINPCSFFWKELIAELNFPFLKRELLTQKKLNIEYDVLEKWKETVLATGYRTDLISQVLSHLEIDEIIRCAPFNNPNLEFHFYYDPASALFSGLLQCFANKTCLEKGADAYLTVTDLAGGSHLTFNLLDLTETGINEYIGKPQSERLLPGSDNGEFNLMLPFSDEVIPYLRSLYLPRTVIIANAGGPEATILRFIRSVIPVSGNLEYLNSPATEKAIIDISDLKEATKEGTISGIPILYGSGQKGRPPESVFDTLNWYHKEYDALPGWYKKIGLVFKVMKGHKRIQIHFVNKSLKISLRHKVTVNELNKGDFIRNWYFHEYEVLPQWFKKFGKMINKNK